MTPVLPSCFENQKSFWAAPMREAHRHSYGIFRKFFGALSRSEPLPKEDRLPESKDETREKEFTPSRNFVRANTLRESLSLRLREDRLLRLPFLPATT